MTSSISPADLRNQTALHRQLVDVRSPSEYSTGHIPGSINIPLDQIESRIDDLYSEVPIILICQMGKRARMAAALLLPCQRSLTVLEGGTNAWIEAGLPVVTSVKTRWSLERQVRLGAGSLVLLGATLALAWNVHWLYMCAFVGFGLTFAGMTDICPMAELLVRLPWNATSRCKLPGATLAVSSTRNVIPNTASGGPGMQECRHE